MAKAESGSFRFLPPGVERVECGLNSTFSTGQTGLKDGVEVEIPKKGISNHPTSTRPTPEGLPAVSVAYQPPSDGAGDKESRQGSSIPSTAS
jgi:hypothetical protein